MFKEDVTQYCPMCQEWAEKYSQLKAEVDELKKQTCGFRPELKHIIDKTCCKYNINTEYYHEKIVEIINNLDKYKQTLTDIIKIAEEQQSWNECNRRFTKTEFEDDILAYNRSALKQILQKISECEGNNDR